MQDNNNTNLNSTFIGGIDKKKSKTGGENLSV